MGGKKEYIQEVTDLFKMVECGQQEELRCPKCRFVGLKVSYTRNRQERYGIWLECPRCGNVEHADRKGRPSGFDERLIDKRYQKLDDEAWYQADKQEKDMDERRKGKGQESK